MNLVSPPAVISDRCASCVVMATSDAASK
jgi:hypothetical protein